MVRGDHNFMQSGPTSLWSKFMKHICYGFTSGLTSVANFNIVVCIFFQYFEIYKVCFITHTSLRSQGFIHNAVVLFIQDHKFDPKDGLHNIPGPNTTRIWHDMELCFWTWSTGTCLAY